MNQNSGCGFTVHPYPHPPVLLKTSMFLWLTSADLPRGPVWGRSVCFCVRKLRRMSLSLIQRLRLEAILEDCSDQLDILGHSLTLRLSREQGPTSAKASSGCTCCTRCRGPSADQLVLLVQWAECLNVVPLNVCAGAGQADQPEERLVGGSTQHKMGSQCQHHRLFSWLSLPLAYPPFSESNSENVGQLHLELEENLSFSFVQHEVEEEEEREKAENIRWFVGKHAILLFLLLMLFFD